MSKIIFILVFLFAFAVCFYNASAAVCFSKVVATKWYCADVRGCTEASDEASMFSPAQCDPPCADMGLDTKIDYADPDEADTDLSSDESCNQICRIRTIRACTY